MRLIKLAVVLTLGLFAAPLVGQAQQPPHGNLSRIGYLCTAPGFLDTRGGYQDSAPTLDR